MGESPKDTSQHSQQRGSKEQPKKPPANWREAVACWIKNNALSLIFFTLFALFLFGQSFAGMYGYNSTLQEYHKPAVSWIGYMSTGQFLDGMFSNWQAALLQLTALILIGMSMRQKGASHSSNEESGGKTKKKEEKAWHESVREWFYANSLGGTFMGLFCGVFILHVFFATQAFNARQALIGKPPVPVLQFIESAEFWFETFRTWEAEFLVIGAYVILSVFLRQAGSGESKPVQAGNKESGKMDQ